MEDDLNPVVYALSNPVSFVDPMGTMSVREALRGLLDFMKKNADIIGDLLIGSIPFLEEILDLLSAISGRDITSWIKGGLQGKPKELGWWDRVITGGKAVILLAGSAFGIWNKVKKAFEKIKDLVNRATKKVGGFRKTCKSLGRGCFVTGTLVLMANGTLLPIEQVKAGDRVQSAIVAPVKSVQEKRGSFEVSGPSKCWYEGAVHAILIGKKRESVTWLKGTPEHPVWLPGERVWKPLAELRTGDLLSGREGLLRVFGHRVSFGRARVFNLRVPGANAYRVSWWGGLVHNAYISHFSRKRTKRLIKKLSKGGKLSQEKLDQLRRIAKKVGGEIDAHRKGVKGIGVKPHAHFLGLGGRIRRRHIFLKDGVK